MRILLISAVIVTAVTLSTGLVRTETVYQEEELITEPVWETAGWKKEPVLPTVTPVPENPDSQPTIKKYSLSSETGSAPRHSLSRHKYKGEPDFMDEELITEPLRESGEAGDEQVESRCSFEARLDRRRAHLDESFTLTLKIIAPELKKISPFRLPHLPEFDIINSYQTDSMTNLDGRIWKVRTRRTVFLARQPGTYSIPPAKIRCFGQWYQTRELEITIEGSRSGDIYQRRGLGRKYNRRAVKASAPDTEQWGGQEPGFAAKISSQKGYVNQQLILTVSWQCQADERTKINYQPPSMTGFLIESLPQHKTEERISGVGQRYVGGVYSTALFPVRAGTLEIGPARLTLTERGKAKEYMTEALTIEVKPLPVDPAPLRRGRGNGLVGNYELQAVLEADRAEAEVPVSLKVTLSGRGNMRTAPAPFLKEDSHYHLYLEEKNEQISWAGGWLEGQRTYSYQVIFPSPGRECLNQAVMRYFDPEQEQWRSAVARIPEIEVLPLSPIEVSGGEEHQPPALYLKPNHSRPVRLRPSRPGMAETGFFWLIHAMGLGAILLVWGGRYLYSRAQPDPKALRMRRAYPQARRSLRPLRRYIRQGEAAKFYMGLTRITSEYLTARFGLASTYIGAERLPEFFEKYNIPVRLHLRFKAALTACEYVRYAAVTLPAKDMRLLYRDLKRAIKEFEKIWQTHKNKSGLRKKVNLAVIITLLAIGSAYAEEAEKHFARGSALARAGRHQEAETAYRKVLACKIKHPALFYNLGNAYIRQGKLGPAILAYERGIHRAPRNRDIKHNLKQAASLIKETGFSGAWT
ncbi:BatD family protein, partial [bacterium]|nr:BatD family protein [bacterium]